MQPHHSESGDATRDGLGQDAAEGPTLDPAGAAGGSAAEPASIGPYRLLRELGAGGMGQVWLAEQLSPVKRQVALKLVAGARFSADALLRFRLEQQTLAMMQHPAIAKVFDGGATAAGQPYFVMEYVPGEAITAYCDRRRLTIRQRLELFVKVCEGVLHAHQKAIVHRDLKPSNILVLEVDGRPTPRIIDFGIAKSVSEDAPAHTMLTGFGGLLGTPGYMSPEQADPAVLDVDTRTDVYSLGVVLYELLSGHTPFDPRQWQGQSFWEALRRLKEEDPPRLSGKVSSDSKTSATHAANRQTQPPQLVNLLRGDLDWIAAKAVAKDRDRRYGSPAELAADIARFLAQEPIVARPPSPAYRLRKYVQRHKVGVAAGAALAVLLTVSAVVQTLALRRVTRERDRADRITHFMVGLFKVSNPSEARGRSVTAQEILDRGAKEITASLSTDPQVRAELMRAMADSYDGLGLYSRALGLTQQAYDIQRREYGPRDRRTLASMSFLASMMFSAGHDAQAMQLLQNALALQEQVLGPDDRDTLRTRLYLCDVMYAESDFQNAESFARDTLARERRVLGPDNMDTIQTMARLADTVDAQGHYAEAEKLRRQVLDAKRRLIGPEAPGTLDTMNALAHVFTEQGKYSEAEVLASEALPPERRVLGPEHPVTLVGLSNFAYLYLKEGKYPEAEKLFRELVDTETRLNGPQSLIPVADTEELAITFAREGRYDEASRLLQRAIAVAESNKEPSYVAIGWYNFACAAALAGHREDAFGYLREAVDHGFVYPDDMSGDKDLVSLHADPRFAAIVAEARQRAAALQKK